MIELNHDRLEFRFPDVHDHAVFSVEFQRTLRIPDDRNDYSLPPGLGAVPIRHVDDFAQRVPEAWMRHGGIMLPMYRSEAMWLNFHSPHGDPFALKVAAGKINAVTGDSWVDPLRHDPQDYVCLPMQPWLDGFCAEKGVIRQFVAMPLGTGFSAEEQTAGSGEHGGIQLIAYPIKAEHYKLDPPSRGRRMSKELGYLEALEMGLAPGGRMRQEIYADVIPLDHWDRDHSSRCFVHLANSQRWKAVTGGDPPTKPPTARTHTNAGLPWFEYFRDAEALKGSEKLAGVKSLAQTLADLTQVINAGNDTVSPRKVVKYGNPSKPRRVREGLL